MFKLKGLSKLERSWVLYDIANSAYILTIVTVLFPLYYDLVGASMDKDYRDSLFMIVTSGIALTTALLSPLIGSLSNYRGNKKKFFLLFFAMAIVGTLLLIIPGLSVFTLLVFFFISSVGYGITNVVYDAFLVDVTTEDRMDYVSSSGYAWGYIGSMIPFFIAIIPYGLVTFGFLSTDYEYISIVFAFIVAMVWWLIYSLPMLRDVKQTYNIENETHVVRKSFKRLAVTFKDIRSYRNIFLFMVSYLFFIDVVNTVIRLAVTIGTSLQVGTSVLLGVVMLVQIIAFPSAIIYGRLTKKYGGKTMIYFGIFIYAITILVTYFINENTTYLMFVVGILVGSAQGGIQSISRSFFAKMLPIEKANEFFGFFSVFGRFAGIVSPFILAVLINVTSTNVAVLGLLGPLALGAFILAFVKSEKAEAVHIEE
jgi:MFS transporter, UMF1 family